MSWHDGVVYQIYPRSFQDSNDDGVGDLAGITARLDHLAWLGVDALWISPFYPSPLADFGYDVSDYTDVDPMFGSMPDFDRLVAAAHERGLKVLLDLVACHTSIQHAWFRDHPGVVHLVEGRSGAEQLDVGFRRPRVEPLRRRALVPALLLSRAAGPRLAQPDGRGGDAGGGPLLGRARRRRVPARRDRPAREGSRRCATTRPRTSRSGCRCWSTSWAATCATRATPSGSARRSARSGRRPATRC